MKYSSGLTCDLKLHFKHKFSQYYSNDRHLQKEYSLWKRSMCLKDDRFVQGKMFEVKRRCQQGEPAMGKIAK